jgi:hypothetical protein
MRSEAEEFRPSTLRADAAEFIPAGSEQREPLSPVRPEARKRNANGETEEAGENADFGENASPNVHGAKSAQHHELRR